MTSGILSVHPGLDSCRRAGLDARQGSRISAAELGLLGLLGASAAWASAFVKTGWGVPGHNILLVIFPMATGMALVPRRGSASVVGASGVAAGGLFTLFGPHGLGSGALAGLAMLGLALDAALRGARCGRGVYLRLAAAGLGANLAAFAVRAGHKLAGDAARPWDLWWPEAVVTYPACGLLAGLISAAVWFRASARQDS